MATTVQSLVVRNPGGYGLNFEAETYMETPTFAETADNLVYDVSGRLGNRKGLTKLHADATIKTDSSPRTGTVTLSGSTPLTVVTSNTKQVTATESSHGRSTGDYVTISGATATGGQTAAQLNIRAVITVVDSNSWKYFTAGTSTSSTSGGGSSVKVQSEPTIDSMAVFNHSAGQYLVYSSKRLKKIYSSPLAGSTVYDDSGTVATADLAIGNWQFVNFDDKIYGANTGTGAIIVKGTGDGADFAPLTGEITLGSNPITTDVGDADGISVAASVGNNEALVIGGALSSEGTVTNNGGRLVTILSAGDDSAISFTVTGTSVTDLAQTESITGANAGTATGVKNFKTITAITAVGNPAGNVSAGIKASGELSITYSLADITINDQDVVTISGATATGGIIADDINIEGTVKEAPVLDALAGTGTFKVDAADLATSTATGGGSAVKVTLPGGIPTGGIIHSAFGRLWAQKSTTGTGKNIISYCGTLTPSSWGVNTTVGGEIDTVGTFSAISNGYDDLVAISSFDKFLIAFMRNSIIVYNNPDSPNDLGIEKIIQGVGCVSRDTVQKVGKDILFLSTTGLRSFRQTVHSENASELTDVSALVRKEFLASLGGETNWPNMKSVWNAEDGQYWLKSPNTNLNDMWVFDLHTLDETLPVRITKFKNTKWDSFAYYQGVVYIGACGILGKYANYQDAIGPTGEETSTDYKCTWRSNMVDFGASNLKFLKKLVTTMIAGSSDVVTVLTESADTGQTSYESHTMSNTQTANRLSNVSGPLAEWGSVEWAAGRDDDANDVNRLLIPTEWGGGTTTYFDLAQNTSGAGRSFLFGIDFNSSGSPVSLEQMAIYAKIGREGR